MSRGFGDGVALTFVVGGIVLLAVLELAIAALIVKGLTHVLHAWWPVIPTMDFGPAASVATLLMLLVNILTWLNIARGAK